MCPVIRIPDHLYERLGNLAVRFETPAQVIERILNQVEGIPMPASEPKAKPGRITDELIRRAYGLAAAVHAGKVGAADAVAELEDQGMDPGSARDYIGNFHKMLTGVCLKRTMNAPTFQYFLENIKKDYDAAAFANALSAVEQHIAYYESFSNGKLRSVRAILDDFKKGS